MIKNREYKNNSGSMINILKITLHKTTHKKRQRPPLAVFAEGVRNNQRK